MTDSSTPVDGERLDLRRRERQFLRALAGHYNSDATLPITLDAILKTTADAFAAIGSALYVREDRVLHGLSDAPDKKRYEPQWQQLYLLAASFPQPTPLPWPHSLPTTKLDLPENVTTGAALFSTASSSKILALPCPADHSLLALFGEMRALYPILILLCLPPQVVPSQRALVTELGPYLESQLPLIEALFRRSLQDLLIAIMDTAGKTTKSPPRRRFHDLFRATCRLLRVEGGSLFTRRLQPLAPDLQQVATYPRTLQPRLAQRTYPADTVGPTQLALDSATDCILPEVHPFRAKIQKLLDLPHLPEPRCPDITDLQKDRALLFTFAITRDNVLYMLRLTNSQRNPTFVFTPLDRFAASRTVSVLALLH